MVYLYNYNTDTVVEVAVVAYITFVYYRYKRKTDPYHYKQSNCASAIAPHLKIVQRRYIDEMNCIEKISSNIVVLFCDMFFL